MFCNKRLPFRYSFLCTFGYMALSREFSSGFVKTFGKVVKWINERKATKTAIFSDIFTRHDDTHLQKSLTVSFPSCQVASFVAKESDKLLPCSTRVHSFYCNKIIVWFFYFSELSWQLPSTSSFFYLITGSLVKRNILKGSFSEHRGFE